MEIFIPDSFIPEREYVINTIFGVFLGLDFKIKIHTAPGEYKIVLPEGGQLIIKDAFFSRFSEVEGYLDKKNIPASVKYLKRTASGYDDLVILFGDTEVIYGDRRVVLEADIFASAFFMLSRWEEYVVKDRDKHNRFDFTSSLAYKFNFLDRPVVNEYTGLVWELLWQIGFKGSRKEKKYTIIPTHDIDHIRYWNSANRKILLKNLSGDLIKRNNLKIAVKRVTSFIKTSFDQTCDPNNSFDYLMTLAEKAGVKACFYFISGVGNIYDPEGYISTPFLNNLIPAIKDRGHYIGIHPSYDSYNNKFKIREEVRILEEAVKVKINSGRQHYLRFEIPYTWKILNDCNLKTDSSMYYSGYPGFRCGTCYEYRVFDVIGRKQLDLIESPLLVMDKCLLKNNPDDAIDKIRSLKSQVRKHKGNFVFNWHNSTTSAEFYKKYRAIFEKEFYE